MTLKVNKPKALLANTAMTVALLEKPSFCMVFAGYLATGKSQCSYSMQFLSLQGLQSHRVCLGSKPNQVVE